VLGNCSDIFYAGELHAWLRMSGISQHSGSERVRFWKTVSAEVGGDDFYGDRTWRCLEHSLALFGIWNWPDRRRLRQRYRSVAKSLYDAIARTASVTHVVDTSHYPLRARELQRVGGIDLYLIYLVRDPQDVVASFRRRDVGAPPKPPRATNAYLCLTHLLSASVFILHPRSKRLLLRYEDFIEAPEQTLRRILEWTDAAAASLDLGCLRTGIPFQGNRLLESDVIALRAEARSPPRRSPSALLTALLQAPCTAVLSLLRPRLTEIRRMTAAEPIVHDGAPRAASPSSQDGVRA
jgi:Sulfotransferase domain